RLLAAGGSQKTLADGISVMMAVVATEAPLVTPMTSGEASGLRISPCVIAPDMARQAPTNAPTMTLGSLSFCTTTTSSLFPWPKIAWVTSHGFTVDEEWHSDDRRHDANRDLPGHGDKTGRNIRKKEQNAAQQRAVGNQPAGIPADESSGDVRDNEPDKPDRSGDGDRAACQHDDEQSHGQLE
ncbi:hypothetical protein BGX30_008659, partial [Mortierella sp. GBA39]